MGNSWADTGAAIERAIAEGMSVNVGVTGAHKASEGKYYAACGHTYGHPAPIWKYADNMHDAVRKAIRAAMAAASAPLTTGSSGHEDV